MKIQTPVQSRRSMIQSSFLTLLAASAARPLMAGSNSDFPHEELVDNRYPAIRETVVSEVVGASHFNLNRVKELVEERPELARAKWDWGFGDWESALGAASHTGRRDIAEYLISRGAVPDVFTFAMMGNFELVRAIILNLPAGKEFFGPHGISLIAHVQTGIKTGAAPAAEGDKLLNYLREIFPEKQNRLAASEAEKESYLGDYRYGDGDGEGFSVRLNMREQLAFGKLGRTGGGLIPKAPGVFGYNGAPSVEIVFQSIGSEVIGLTVYEPGFEITAKKD